MRGAVDATLFLSSNVSEIAQVVCHHANIGSPLFLQTDKHRIPMECTPARPHTVKAVDTPEFGLHAAR